ncbi:MAG: hypothetical protein KDJ35_07440 [Alphaproteobacteria bacterium]|nr:hypothetical protein [Alphaproteobacteria bacterium]
MKFNETFAESGEKPRFISKPNPLVERSFQIFEFQEEKRSYEPVGEYTLLDHDEAVDITQKKVMNLIAIMNEKQRLIDFKNLTNERILYNIISTNPDSEQQKVMFRTYDGSGVSKENAVLTLDRGVFHEES